jgi:hypothetical protein
MAQPAVALNLFRDAIAEVDDQSTPQACMAAIANQLVGLTPAIAEIVQAIPNEVMNQDAKNVIINRLNDRVNNAILIRDRAIAQENRAFHEHVIPLISEIPIANPPNMVHEVPEARLYKLLDFGGDDDDKITALAWLSRLLRLGEMRHLSHDAILGLLERHTTGSAAQVVSESNRARLGLTECVRALEVRYADLQHPDSARIAVNAMDRTDKESIGQLADRIKRLAFMATRLTLDRDEQMRQEEDLASTNLIRCLRPVIRKAITDKISSRRVAGTIEYTYPALTAQCEDLEKREDAMKRLNFKDAAVKEAVKKITELETEAKELKEREDTATVALPTTEAGETVRLLKELAIKQDKQIGEITKFVQQDRYSNSSQDRNQNRSRSWEQRPNRNQGYYPPQQQQQTGRYRFDSKGREYNDRNYRNRSGDRQYAGERRSRRDSPHPNSMRPRAGSYENRSLSSNRPQRSDSGSPLDFSTLNVGRGECARCGLSNHYYNSRYCPLSGKQLTSKPCANCGKGGHLPMDCTRGSKN